MTLFCPCQITGKLVLSWPKETQQLIKKFNIKLKCYKQMSKFLSDNEYGFPQHRWWLAFTMAWIGIAAASIWVWLLSKSCEHFFQAHFLDNQPCFACNSYTNLARNARLVPFWRSFQDLSNCHQFFVNLFRNS